MAKLKMRPWTILNRTKAEPGMGPWRIGLVDAKRAIFPEDERVIDLWKQYIPNELTLRVHERRPNSLIVIIPVESNREARDQFLEDLAKEVKFKEENMI